MNNKELNISIFSYNVFWKIMDDDSKIHFKNIEKKILNQMKSNILKNIISIKNYYNPFIYCFQESKNYSDIIDIFDKLIYDHDIGYAEPEYILTIWNKNILKKKFVIHGEFELGRPFSIIIFKDLRYNIYFILINIHTGHHNDTLLTVFKPIQNYLNLYKEKLSKYDIKRLLIIGDFNRDIGNQINYDIKKYFLKINLKKYYFNSLITKNKTCCSLSGYGYTKNYDQIIDSYDKPLLVHPLNKESWYIPKSSDHLGILSIVKNYT